MADSFASLNRRVDRFRKETTDDKLGHDLGQMAKREAHKAASADLGGDPKFSGWAPMLDVRYDLKGPGQVLVTPTRRSAGPWTVAEHGRNTGIGPRLQDSSLTSTGRVSRRRKKRWNGRTAGKGTATSAVDAIESKAPGVVEAQIGRAIRKAF